MSICKKWAVEALQCGPRWPYRIMDKCVVPESRRIQGCQLARKALSQLSVLGQEAVAHASQDLVTHGELLCLLFTLS